MSRRSGGRVWCVRLATVLLALAAPVQADASTQWVEEQPSNRGFDVDADGWSHVASCDATCTVTTAHATTGGNPGGAIRTSFSVQLGLPGAVAGAGAWTSDAFTLAAGSPDAAVVAVDRLASLDALSASGGGARWTIELVDDTATTSTTLTDAPLSTDAAWSSVSLSVIPSQLIASHRYRLRLALSFATGIGPASDATVLLDNVRLRAQYHLDEEPVDRSSPPPETVLLPGGTRTTCTIVGTSRADRIVGTPGRDVICAGAGNDVVDGGAGDDVIAGVGGNDVLRGGPGRDTVVGGPGSDQLFGGAGVDVIRGWGGRDRIDGGTGADWLYGDAGADTIVDHHGRDTLLGGSGADAVDAEDGRADDRIFCGLRLDVASVDVGDPTRACERVRRRRR